MNTLIQFIILLACLGIPASATITNCRCLRTRNYVQPSLIVDVNVYNPRPYCRQKEVIVLLKNNTSECLNPSHRFTIAVIKTIQIQKAANKMNAIIPNATTVSAM